MPSVTVLWRCWCCKYHINGEIIQENLNTVLIRSYEPVNLPIHLTNIGGYYIPRFLVFAVLHCTRKQFGSIALHLKKPDFLDRNAA